MYAHLYNSCVTRFTINIFIIIRLYKYYGAKIQNKTIPQADDNSRGVATPDDNEEQPLVADDNNDNGNNNDTDDDDN